MWCFNGDFFMFSQQKFWQITSWNLPLNTTLHCIWCEQPCSVSRRRDFIQKYIFFFCDKKKSKLHHTTIRMKYLLLLLPSNCWPWTSWRRHRILGEAWNWHIWSTYLFFQNVMIFFFFFLTWFKIKERKFFHSPFPLC